MELELRHLKVVCTIAELGSVTKAAAELGVAQPALTAQLGRIERSLGGPLFERDHRGVRPTAIGDLVINRARLLLPAMTGLIEDVTRFSDDERHKTIPDHVSIGASTPAILAPLIRRLNRENPHLHVWTTASWSGQWLATELNDGRLDYVVAGTCGSSPPPGDPSLVWRTFAVDPVFVLLPQSHDLAAADHIELGQLSSANWAAAPGDGCFHDCFAQACARSGFAPRNLYVADPASCIDMVVDGTAVALCQATRTMPGLVTKPLLGAPLQWRQMVGWRPESAVADFADDLLSLIRLAHADLVAHAPTYVDWLEQNPEFGGQFDPGITPAI